jgi:hypothetical protein
LGLTLDEVSALFDKAYPMLSLTEERVRRRDSAALWIAFDLRRGLDDQLETAGKRLRILKNELDAIYGRRRMRSVSSDVAWRNLRCYLLADRGGLTAKEIGAEVFPKDRGAADKVRKILSDVRQRLRRATSISS